MAGRLYPLNRFIAPDFGLLVPDWTFGMAMDDYCAASYSYAGPVYVLLTPADIAVLINISPERERDGRVPAGCAPGARVDEERIQQIADREMPPRPHAG